MQKRLHENESFFLAHAVYKINEIITFEIED